MKTRMIIVTLCTIALSFGVAFTSFAGALPGTGIVLSKHDMNSWVGANGGNVDAQLRVCAYCHTPHHALEDLDADCMPLWSHEITSEVFIEYDSTTIDGIQAGIDTVIGPSRLCMGCHDGAVAIDAYYGNSGTATLVGGDAWGEIGVGLNGDLTNDHPIGFDYNDVATADDEINPSTAVFDGGKTVAEVLYDDGFGGAIMTCASCHDVHNSAGVSDYAFLYGNQAGSSFCITCHDK